MTLCISHFKYSHRLPHYIDWLMSLGEFLEGRDYNTDNPYVREIIND